MLDKIKSKIKGQSADIYTGLDKQSIKESFSANQKYVLAKDEYSSTELDQFMALASLVRSRIADRWIKTQQSYHKNNVRRVYYLSLEFLIGRLLGNYMFNLGIEDESAKALEELGIDLEELRDQELDAGLGNGGLGRLAACFLDSMASLGIPACGYGIRYDYGIFHQKIINGKQVELPDEWLKYGNPWEYERPEYTMRIQFNGRVEHSVDEQGHAVMKWVDTDDVLAVPFDVPIPGYKNGVVNTLRLWSAKGTDDFNLEYFNHGDYEKAVYDQILSENISKVLYPNDNNSKGKELRLKQEHFFTAASIADIIRRYKSDNNNLHKLHEKVCIQLNDTHPTLAVVELMRILVDQEGLPWEGSWNIVKRTFAYTNHTLLPEALECWDLDLLEKVLPRHLSIIYEINARFLDEVSKKFPNDTDRLSRMSIIQEGTNKRVRMANLAIVGSFSVNGVSALHSKLLTENLFKDFYELYPERFNSKTNGITQRRWLLKANTGLSNLITSKTDDQWITKLDKLKQLEKYVDDTSFQDQWQQVKLANKQYLADHILKTSQIEINPHSLFDVQVKRLHEYKRQLLFVLYVLSEYLNIKDDPNKFDQPRTFMIGGKAAPGYHMAKLIIQLIMRVSDTINNDPTVSDKIKLVFLENYRVSLAEKVFPATDLSEQISTAGMEASGTGNMKFMLNGALTIGTLDGANVEMAQQLEDEDIFIFGLKVHEVAQLKQEGYRPQHYIENSIMLSRVIQMLKDNFFSADQPGLFDPIVDSLTQTDMYMLCADFDSYVAKQQEVSEAFKDQKSWTKKSIKNTANSGFFSSDRTISDYAKDIWNV